MFKRNIDRWKSVFLSLGRIEKNLDKINKRISMLHNKENVKTSRPLAWLTPEERERAEELKRKNPDMFEYITECLKLFLGGNEGND